LDPVKGYALVFLLSLTPTFEARYAIVLGMGMGLNPLVCAALCASATLLLAACLTAAMRLIDELVKRLGESGSRVGSAIYSLYARIVEGVSRRARRYVEKWGVVGIALFVAVPVPATGVWSGAVASYVLGLRGARAFAALALGGLASMALTGALAALGYAALR